MANKLARNTGNSILEMIQDRHPGYHPLLAIADLAHHQGASLELQLNCHKTIAEFITPKLKTVEHVDKNNGRTITVSLFGDSDVDDIEEAEIVDKNDYSGSRAITVK